METKAEEDKMKKTKADEGKMKAKNEVKKKTE
jgi:hypothetical protein